MNTHRYYCETCTNIEDDANEQKKWTKVKLAVSYGDIILRRMKDKEQVETEEHTEKLMCSSCLKKVGIFIETDKDCPSIYIKESESVKRRFLGRLQELVATFIQNDVS